MTDGQIDDPVAGFAALMAGANAEANPADPAPFGYMIDAETGQERPKKSPGRPRKSPTLDELKQAREAEPSNDLADGNGDRPPAPASKGRRGRRRSGGPAGGTPKPPPAVPQAFRYEGGLAKGINRLYRKAGRLLIAFGAEPEGKALVEITRAEDDDDVTVGDAWEQLCRTNPRVRAFWLRLLAGGAVSAVVMAHLPVVIAFLMRPGVAERIPFGKLFAAVAEEEPGEQAPSSSGAPSMPDMAAMAEMARAMAEQVMTSRANGVPERAPDGQPVG